MKTTRKFFALLLALLMLTACMGAFAEELDTSEYVALRLFAIADAPNDAELGAKFMEELNAKLKEELNCTIKYEYASGNNYANNYQLALASGTEYDLMHSANWLDYPTFALKGAYMDLKDLLPVYAPNVWALISEEKWAEVSVNGAIYGMPHKWWDGRTPLRNLRLVGADQGYLGIVGAMLSGVTVANDILRG